MCVALWRKGGKISTPLYKEIEKKTKRKLCHECGRSSKIFCDRNDLKPNLTSVLGAVKFLGEAGACSVLRRKGWNLQPPVAKNREKRDQEASCEV